jgi:signal transduction histidine kinase
MSRWERPGGPRETVFGRAATQFVIASLVVLVLLAVGTFLVARQLAGDLALRDARSRGTTYAHSVVGPIINSAVRAGDPTARATLDVLMRSRIEDGSIQHIKIWAPDGEVLWSDEPGLAGTRFELEDKVSALFGTEDSTADISDLSKVENAQDRAAGQLLEVYVGAHDADGVPIVVESYWTTEHLTENQSAILIRVVPLSIGALLLLTLAVLPLALSLARRVDRAQAERARMLGHALSASRLEQRRIAQDLHDGLIQDLAGLGYALPAVADLLPSDAVEARGVLAEVGAGLERDIAALRELLTDVYPSDLARVGLTSALRELAGRAAIGGLQVEVAVDPDLAVGTSEVALLAYRVAREGLRNVVRHSRASFAEISLDTEGEDVVVTITDDGVGLSRGSEFPKVDDAADVPQASEPSPSPAGHLGLRLLSDTLHDVGGQLSLVSPPEGGTRMTARFPRAFAEAWA